MATGWAPRPFYKPRQQGGSWGKCPRFSLLVHSQLWLGPPYGQTLGEFRGQGAKLVLFVRPRGGWRTLRAALKGKRREPSIAGMPPRLVEQPASHRPLSISFFGYDSNTSLQYPPSCGICRASSLSGPTGASFCRLRKKGKHPGSPFGVKRL